MADVVSPKDRALIEAALAAGRVTVVPRGVSGLPQYVCDPVTGKLVTGMTGAQVRKAKAAETHRRLERARRLRLWSLA